MPVAPSAGFPQFTLLTGSGGAQPYAFGMGLRRGDFPSSAGIIVSGAVTGRATVLARWDDGSALWIQVAGTAMANTTIAVSSGTVAAGGAVLTTTDVPSGLRSAGMSIGCGAFGTATWTGTDFDTPQATWVSTPEYSCFIYRKNVGSDPHLQGCVELRLWASGAVEVLPWIENGRVRVAGPTNKSAVYSFTLAGVEKFNSGSAVDLKNHQRAALVSGAAISHWLGSDPGVTAKHDMLYLMSTRLVPSYRGTVSPTASIVTSLPSTWTMLQEGGIVYSGDMGSAGYQSPIGLLTQSDVVHLTTTADTFAATVRSGYAVGRYGLHYRDENTGKPIRFSQFPNTVANTGSGLRDLGSSETGDYLPVNTGGSAPTWSGSHHPAAGFLQALITGRHYFMEQVHFSATANYLNITDLYRGFSNGVFDGYRLGTRTEAWCLRTLLQAYLLTPDADPLKSEFLASITAHIEHNHTRYIAQPHNGLGLMANIDYGGYPFIRSSIWMNDFVVSVYGYLRALSVPITGGAPAKFTAFWNWLARSVVDRLSAQGSGYWYINACPYTLAYTTNLTANWLTGVGSWHTSWTNVYTATAAMANNSPSFGSREGILASGDGDVTATGYWANMLPALTYAVEHGVSGAREAYDRLTGATNWRTLEHQFDATPHWGMRPAAGVEPAWMAGKPYNTWFEVSGTTLTTFNDGTQLVPPGILDDYSGYVFNQAKGEALYWGGGHAGSSYNGTIRINWLADSPAPALSSAATPLGSRVNGVVWWGTAPNQKPNVPHTYNDGEFVAELQSYVWAAMRSPWDFSGTLSSNAIRLNRDPATGAGTWAQPGSGDDLGASVGSTATAQDLNGVIYTINGGNVRGIGRFVPGTGWSVHASSGLDFSGFAALVYDSRRNRLMRIGDYTLPGYATVSIPGGGGTGTLADVSPASAASPKINGDAGLITALNTFIGLDTVGVCYVPDDDAVWVPRGESSGAYYRIDAATLTATLVTPPTLAGIVPSRVVTAGGLFKRMHYSQQLRAVIYHPNPAANAWVIRIKPR
jgi:hypothetical protein